MELLEAKKKQFEGFMAKQPPSVEVAVATGSGAVQGGLIGAMMATFSAMEPPGAAAAGMAPKVRAATACYSAAMGRLCAASGGARRELIFPKLQPPGMVGGPAVLARNFAVMTGVNAGLQCAIKKARGGVEDVKGRCAGRRAAEAPRRSSSAVCHANAAFARSMAASFGAGAAFSVVSAIGAPVRARCAAALRVARWLYLTRSYP